MKIYIAARYGRKDELKKLFAQIELAGHKCTSRWISEGEEGKTQMEAAMMDVDDVLRADALVFVGEPSGSVNRGGGRWFEFGVAYHAGKTCYTILTREGEIGEGHFGSREGHESVFTHLPSVVNFYSHEDFLEHLETV